MQKIKKYADYIAFIFLFLMFFLMVFSMRKDTSIRDEMPHIVAGYSYWTKFDYRINPEHPPLVKQLSTFPLLFMDVNFPDERSEWKDNVNDQWRLGEIFLYESGNDADKLLFWSRIPIVILTIIAGLILYLWANDLFKNKLSGLIALLLFAFSPNVMAHGRFITTDMGILAFSLFALYTWYNFLKSPNWKTFSVATLFQAFMHLAKFSSPLFIPPIILMAIFAVLFNKKLWDWKKRAKIYFGATILSFLAALFIIGIWYQAFMFKMPFETQQRLIEESATYEILKERNIDNLLLNTVKYPILRPHTQYFLGFFMVMGHATQGHDTYFMGEVGQNWPDYYFIAYLLKEPIVSQILLLVSVAIAVSWIYWFIRSKSKRKEFYEFMEKYSVLIVFCCLITGILFLGAMAKLQLGIRYVLAVFPYLYIMIGGAVAIGFAYKNEIFERIKPYFLGTLAFWLIIANFLIYPHYLAYFNEYVGGYKNGWKYLIDSNLDWGQDLRRLKQFMDENRVEHIKIDYFGGGSVDYYLGESNYTVWGYDKGRTNGWVAISVNAIQWNSENGDEKGNYKWLTENYEPVEKIGGSIFVYHIED